MSDDRQHRIRQRAHAIWESHGRPHGYDRDHWDQASREIDAEDAAKATKPVRAAAKPKAAARPKAGPKAGPKASTMKKPAARKTA